MNEKVIDPDGLKRGLTPWVGFDLDGTLAHHESGDSIDTVGEPIPEMIQNVLNCMNAGWEVRIFTARVWCPTDEHWNKELANDVARQRIMIMDWCEKHIGKRLKVTCEKDPGMVSLYDDRAYHVPRNSGKIIGVD